MFFCKLLSMTYINDIKDDSRVQNLNANNFNVKVYNMVNQSLYVIFESLIPIHVVNYNICDISEQYVSTEKQRLYWILHWPIFLLYMYNNTAI